MNETEEAAKARREGYTRNVAAHKNQSPDWPGPRSVAPRGTRRVASFISGARVAAEEDEPGGEDAAGEGTEAASYYKLLHELEKTSKPRFNTRAFARAFDAGDGCAMLQQANRQNPMPWALVALLGGTVGEPLIHGTSRDVRSEVMLLASSHSTGGGGEKSSRAETLLSLLSCEGPHALTQNTEDSATHMEAAWSFLALVGEVLKSDLETETTGERFGPALACTFMEVSHAAMRAALVRGVTSGVALIAPDSWLGAALNFFPLLLLMRARRWTRARLRQEVSSILSPALQVFSEAAVSASSSSPEGKARLSEATAKVLSQTRTFFDCFFEPLAPVLAFKGIQSVEFSELVLGLAQGGKWKAIAALLKSFVAPVLLPFILTEDLGSGITLLSISLSSGTCEGGRGQSSRTKCSRCGCEGEGGVITSPWTLKKECNCVGCANHGCAQSPYDLLVLGEVLREGIFLPASTSSISSDVFGFHNEVCSSDDW